MPRGSKPGERRGGRQRGTPNKKTALRNVAIGAADLDPNISLRDFMLGLMRNSDLPLADRFTAAQAALPLLHPKLTMGRAKEGTSGEYGYDQCDVNVKEKSDSEARVIVTEKSESGARVTPTRQEAGEGVATRTKGVDLSPLDLFLEVMRDPEAPFDLRTKAARIVAPFVHPKPASRKPGLVINDPHGFVVDSVAAREVRDAHRRFLRLFQTVHMRGWEDKRHHDAYGRYKDMAWSLGRSTECPTSYTSEDEDKDLGRRDELFEKWRQGNFPHQLTPEEDAEEAHLYARIEAFGAARGRAERRIIALRELGDKRTATEQSELDALELRYRRVRETNWPPRSVS
jgi:hypothetical protein